MKIGLILLSITLSYSLFAQERYAVVIDEIMADPSPAVGLPTVEWVELRNRSRVAINLQGWRIGDESGQSGPLPAFILAPDSVVIICTGTALPLLSAFGPALAVTSFPSLDNIGELLSLRAGGKTIHAVRYESGWLTNELKQEGGWSLEMIDPDDPCSGSRNWTASRSPSGGTPGRINSVQDNLGAPPPPRAINSYSSDSTTLVIEFAEAIDSASGASPGSYLIAPDPVVSGVNMPGPLFQTVVLKLNQPLAENLTYLVQVNSVRGCSGQAMSETSVIRTGRPSEPSAGDWIVNEVLFDPRPNAFDFVEGYNKSNRILDASRLYIANRNESASLSSITALSKTPRYIFPGEYWVITEDADRLGLEYLVKNPDQVLTASSLPSFPDYAGDVVLLNGQGAITDELKYDKRWQFALIADPEGIALERIDPDQPTLDAGNWHSAGSTAGFGTPTYINSQFKRPGQANSEITVSPSIFSPDGDGRDDVAGIQYQTGESGWVATVTIFDLSGRPVRSLVRNAMLSRQGYWNWDGLDDRGRGLPLGPYIVHTLLFDLQGHSHQFRNSLVLVRRLHH